VGIQESAVLHCSTEICSENNKLILLSTNDKAERGEEIDSGYVFVAIYCISNVFEMVFTYARIS
jgi:hypothetical protein